MSTQQHETAERQVLALVTSSFPVGGDGSEAAGSFVSDLVDELAQHVTVHVVAPGPENARESWSRGITVHRFAAPPQPLSTLKSWNPNDLRWILRVLRGGQKATHQAIAAGANHVLALWGLPCGEWARRAARKAGIGYDVWLLGSDVWTLGRVPILRNQLARVLQQAERVWADGYQLADDAARIGAVPVGFLPSTRKITLVNPTPVRSEPPYRLLFLGRWHRNKGVDLLLEAFALLDDADWQSIDKVEIQGGGPLEPLVRQKSAALRNAGRPLEVGSFLTKPEAEAAIARADWVLIPSRIESIPVVFSDAMKLGRPVIAMPTGDLPALLRDEPTCGILADSISAESLAAAIHYTIAQPTTSFTAGIASRAHRFDLEEVARRIQDKVVQAHG